MKIDLSAETIVRGISGFLHRFHIVLFAVLALGGMAAMMFMINQTITRSTDTSQQQSSATSISFDEKTIEQLGELSSGPGGSINLPNDQRINPFVD